MKRQNDVINTTNIEESPYDLQVLEQFVFFIRFSPLCVIEVRTECAHRKRQWSCLEGNIWRKFCEKLTPSVLPSNLSFISNFLLSTSSEKWSDRTNNDTIIASIAHYNLWGQRHLKRAGYGQLFHPISRFISISKLLSDGTGLTGYTESDTSRWIQRFCISPQLLQYAAVLELGCWMPTAITWAVTAV